MKSSNFDESEIPWPMPNPCTPAERSKRDRMDYDQRYMAAEFGNPSFRLADAKGYAARLRGLPMDACPVRLEWEGTEGVLAIGWRIGWQRADEDEQGL